MKDVVYDETPDAHPDPYRQLLLFQSAEECLTLPGFSTVCAWPGVQGGKWEASRRGGTMYPWTV